VVETFRAWRRALKAEGSWMLAEAARERGAGWDRETLAEELRENHPIV
jgi:hypothetical protein